MPTTTELEIKISHMCAPCLEAVRTGSGDYAPRDPSEPIPTPTDRLICRRCG